MLSKRSNIAGSFLDRVETTIKQLKYNEALHPNHEHKLKDNQKSRLPARTKRYIQQIEEQIGDLASENKSLQKKLRKNLDKRKELKYYLARLQESWDLYKGNHPFQTDLKKVHKENEEYE